MADRLNMSLDDIIKKQREERKKQPKAAKPAKKTQEKKANSSPDRSPRQPKPKSPAAGNVYAYPSSCPLFTWRVTCCIRIYTSCKYSLRFKTLCFY